MRFYRISFVTGLAVGFVAGARAGREKYDQMVKVARQTADNPQVQQAAGAIQAQATGLLSTATQQLHDRAPQLAHMLEDHIPVLRHRNGHDGSSVSSGPDAAAGRPYAATASHGSQASHGSTKPSSS
jgi:hypothetical protein